jgi:hypothetical protein
MRAILKVKGGFEKQVDVPHPPPREWYMAEMEDNLSVYQPGDGLDDLADIHVTRRTFILKSVRDPEEAFRMLAEQSRFNHTRDYLQTARDEVMHRHYREFGVYEPVAIYEEESLSPAQKKKLVDRCYKMAVEEGLISPDIPVEADNKRFIELDNEFQDP